MQKFCEKCGRELIDGKCPVCDDDVNSHDGSTKASESLDVIKKELLELWRLIKIFIKEPVKGARLLCNSTNNSTKYIVLCLYLVAPAVAVFFLINSIISKSIYFAYVPINKLTVSFGVMVCFATYIIVLATVTSLLSGFLSKKIDWSAAFNIVISSVVPSMVLMVCIAVLTLLFGANLYTGNFTMLALIMLFITCVVLGLLIDGQLLSEMLGQQDPAAIVVTVSYALSTCATLFMIYYFIGSTLSSLTSFF